jgi:hypothetical protein
MMMEDEDSDFLAKLGQDQQEWERRAVAAQSKAAQAYSRLLTLAEKSDTGQASRCASFIAATYNGRHHFDLFDLRVMDVTLSDDMMACLEALRWGRADLYRLVPEGQNRVEAILNSWQIKHPQ